MKISVITPSFNQGQYIRDTILSVLHQKGNFELEYIVIDGGSKDNTLDIIREFENDLTYVSETDKGQSDAINKGFNMATGDLFAWLNSDDTYEEGALNEVTKSYQKNAFSWCFGNCRNIDENGREIRKLVTWFKKYGSRRYSYRRLLANDFISQPAVFINRQTFREIGPLDVNLHFTMDYDYWLRIGRVYDPFFIDKNLANFRWHKRSKSGQAYKLRAYEGHLTAKRYVDPKDRYIVFRHYLHYVLINLIYRFL